MIADNTVRRIIAAARIEDVVGDYLQLKPKGKRLLGLCPFHADHHATNFVVYPAKNCYKCFACGAQGDAVKFVQQMDGCDFADAIRKLGSKYGIPVDGDTRQWTPPPPRPQPKPLPTLTLPHSIVARRIEQGNDNLCEWLRSLPWDGAQRARIDRVLREYCVGHSTIEQRDWNGNPVRHDFTLFWQIDADGNVRTAHYMKYKPNGKRMHREDDKYNTDWFHALLERTHKTQYYDPAKQEVRQCLFGEHLLQQYPNADVHIVESEKSALIMAIAYGNHPRQVWMACCGASNLTRERLAPLIKAKRRILIYPDRDGISAWRKAAKKIDYANLTLSTKLVTTYWREEDGAKADCADIIIRWVQSAATRTVQSLVAKAPAFAKLVEKYDLQPNNGTEK